MDILISTMIDLEDLDYEPDDIENQIEDTQECSYQVPEPSGQDFQDTDYNSSGEPSLSNGLELEGPPLHIQSFREKMNYINMHIDGDKDSCRNQFGRYSTASQSFCLDSSDEESDHRISGDDYDDDKQDDNYIPNTDYIESENSQESQLYYAESIASDSNSYGYMIPLQNRTTSTDTRTASKSDATQGTPNLSRVPNNSSQELSRTTSEQTTKETPSENSLSTSNTKRKSFNFTIQVKGDQRCCLNTPVIRKKRKPWLTSAQQRPDNIVSLTSKDETLQFCPDGTSTSSIVSTESGDEIPVEKQLSGFKIPLKRPPTRQKTSAKSLSVSVDQTGTMTVRDADDNSDIISLIASTNIEDEQDDTDSPVDKQVNAGQSSSLGTNAGQINSEAIPSSIETSNTNRVSEWVQQSGPIPAIYRGLCYAFFFRNNCRTNHCRNSHVLFYHRTKIGQMSTLSDVKLKEAYDFAKANPVFFGKIYRVFAEVFGTRDNKAELINMVDIIFDDSYDINKVEGLRVILESLQKTDLGNFEDAIYYVLLEIGLRVYSNLGSVLLEIIVSTTTGARSCWPVLRNLFIARNKIPARLAPRFLVNLLREPVDYKICQDVNQQILKYNCLDLSLVPYDIREAFLKNSSLDWDKRNGNNVPGLERDLSKEPENYDESNTETLTVTKENTGSNEISRTEYSLAPSKFPASGGVKRNFFRPIRTEEVSVARPLHNGSFVPPREFGMNLGIPQDFASLSQQQTTFAPSNVNIPNEVNNPMYVFTVPPPTINKNIQRYNSLNSSEDEITLESIHSDSDSNLGQNAYFADNFSSKISGSTLMTYRRDGLQYDPARDYIPPNKKRRCAESGHPGGLAPGLDRLPRSNISAENRNKQQMMLSSRSDEQWSPQPDLEYVRPTEPLVSSSSELMHRNEKPPEQPVFGKIYFDPNYEFNVSLHNLYLQKIDNVDIDEEDVHKLNNCVKMSDGRKFLALAYKYVGPVTIQNFISMTLAHLKGLNQMVARTYKRLLASIEEHNPFFFGELKIRVLLEVITMNMLFEFEKRNKFDDAKDLLLKFSNWDSLVTSRLFITDTRTGISIVGRYLFIARMMTFSKPELTYEILACPNLHLLEHYHNWPYHPQCSDPDILKADLEARNNVLINFLKQGFLLNTAAVTQLYKLALKRNAGIWSFDVKPFINPMVVALINKKQIVSLKQIHSEINLFSNYMQKSTLRAYLATMSRHLITTDVFQLFEKCIARNVYQTLVKGQFLEDTIIITTNLLYEEIEIIIIYYFSKMAELGNVPQYLQFIIQLPEDKIPTAIEILNKNKSIKIIQNTIKRILEFRCNVNSKTHIADMVDVDRSELLNFVRNEKQIRA